MLIKMSSSHEIDQLSAKFKEIDKDGSGMVDGEELMKVV